MNLSRGIYKAARTVRTAEQVSRGRTGSRVKNVAVGRGTAKAGLFRSLFGSGRRGRRS